MTARNVFPTAFALLLIAVFAVSLIWHGIQASSKGERTEFANTHNCDLARFHLNQADECLVKVLDGLRRIRTAKARNVIGDQRTADKFQSLIVALRERLSPVREMADDTLNHAVVPEVNPFDED